MRIAHLTDLHVQSFPRFAELRPKRILGTANLYLGGRRHHFSSEVQSAAVQMAASLKPDLTLITGDLTAQGLEAEFDAARELLLPLAETAPLYLIPGNHDIYVDEDRPGDRMRAHLGQWMSPTSPGLATFQAASALYIETCQSTWRSDGTTDLDQLDQARSLIDQAEGFLFLCLHYPLRNRRNEPYGPARRANRHAAEIEAWLAAQGRIDAVLHGHEHHGFRGEIDTAAGPIPILNPGASGYAMLAQKNRTAHFNVYTVEGRTLSSVERYRWDGEAFRPEPGGAYETKR